MTEPTIEEALHFAKTAVDDAMANNRKMYAHEKSEVYRANMPQITSRAAARAYIACVAQGVALRYFDMNAARGYLYIAQLALAAFRDEPSKRPLQPVESTVKRPRKAGSK